jgi:UDP-N-acetylmuramate--alanine ligase
METFEIGHYNSYFFIGIAGVGMSAIAQYLNGIGKQVSGSDRQFGQSKANEIQLKLNAEGIQTFRQDGEGITPEIQICIVSTAVELSNPEIAKASELNIPIVNRADLLAAITRTKKTVAVSGTSGKSSTAAMIYHIMEQTGKPVSFIGGAGLVVLQETGSLGNAIASDSQWLVIEADESDGSLVKYKPEIGILLNIDKDHKEIAELETIFETFKRNTTGKFIVNQSQIRARKFSSDIHSDFGYESDCGFNASGFMQKGFSIQFKINGVGFNLPSIGMHSMENATAAVAACFQMGVSVDEASVTLSTYKGIYRRHQVIGKAKGLTIIDDYAHNPIKIAASIRSCQFSGSKLFVWFQPHGFGPTKFLRNDFVAEISNALRAEDEIWMSEIYYAGGTVVKDISASELIDDIKNNHKNAFFIENRKVLPDVLKHRFSKGDVLLLTGARDPSLEKFANYVFQALIEQ